MQFSKSSQVTDGKCTILAKYVRRNIQFQTTSVASERCYNKYISLMEHTYDRIRKDWSFFLLGRFQQFWETSVRWPKYEYL